MIGAARYEMLLLYIPTVVKLLRIVNLSLLSLLCLLKVLTPLIREDSDILGR